VNTIILKTGSSQQGSALAESILVFWALTIFMIGIPTLGTLVDLKQTVIHASRYAAWEKTVYADGNSALDQIDARFFRDQSAPLRSLRPPTYQLQHHALWGSTQYAAEQRNSEVGNANNPFFRAYPANHNNLSLYQRSRVSADVDNVIVVNQEIGSPGTGIDSVENQPGETVGVIYKQLSKAVSTIGTSLNSEAWGSESLHVNGLMQSTVEINVNNNEFTQTNGINCSNRDNSCIRESTAILTDGWAAAEPDTIRKRVQAFVPSSELETVGKLISKVAVIPMLQDLSNLENAFGCVKLGVRPGKKLPDRLPEFSPMDDKDEC